MEATVESKFNAIAERYDRQRTQLIPCFQDFYQITVENLNLSNSSPEILDLGAGTGLLSEFVLQKYPEASLTLIDMSEKMLDVAKKRFHQNSKIKIIHQDFTRFTTSISYDSIISSLAIHHLEDFDKIKLYNSIYSMLKNGGIFLNAEQIAGDDRYFTELYEKRWKNKVENSHLTQEEIEASYERIKLDKRTPLFTQLQWLKEAGFTEVDCLYKYYDFAVIYGKK